MLDIPKCDILADWSEAKQYFSYAPLPHKNVTFKMAKLEKFKKRVFFCYIKIYFNKKYDVNNHLEPSKDKHFVEKCFMLYIAGILSMFYATYVVIFCT